MSNNKLKQLRKKLLSLSEDEYNSLLDTSEDKPQWQWDMSSRQKNVPKLQSHKDNIKAAVVKRKTNPSWVATRGMFHESNSQKVIVHKGTKVGNAKWGTLDLIDIKYFGTFDSMHQAATACGVTTSAVSACVAGKIRFAKGYTFEKA
jgi:hypothetical protein